MMRTVLSSIARKNHSLVNEWIACVSLNRTLIDQSRLLTFCITFSYKKSCITAYHNYNIMVVELTLNLLS